MVQRYSDGVLAFSDVLCYEMDQSYRLILHGTLRIALLLLLLLLVLPSRKSQFSTTISKEGYWVLHRIANFGSSSRHITRFTR